MGLRVNTNVAALSAQRNLGRQQKRAEHAMASISSGSRIINAADDAAGLAISENLKGQARGIAQARSNAFNATSLIQVSEGGLNEINNILIRIRELGVQAASDNIGEAERRFLNTELETLVAEADRISLTTRFGDKVLLDGSGGEMEYHVGPYSGEENIIKVSLSSNARADELGIDDINVLDKGDARDTLDAVDAALLKIGNLRANFGAVQNGLETTVNNLDIQYENISAANSRLRDTDVAHSTSELASAQVIQAAGIAVLAQANQTTSAALRLIS